MRDVCSGVIWLVLVVGIFFAVASQAEDQEGVPHPGADTQAIEGHPKNCLACRYRGSMLPAEIGDDTVWLSTTGGERGKTGSGDDTAWVKTVGVESDQTGY